MSQENEAQSVTWLELLIIFERSGYRRKVTREGKQEEVREALQKGDSHTIRWNKFRHNENKERPNATRERKNGRTKINDEFTIR